MEPVVCEFCKKPLLDSVVSFNKKLYHANTGPDGQKAERPFTCFDQAMKFAVPEPR